MFFRRGVGDAPDPWLTVKLWLFGAGALLALLGMTLANDWLIGAAAVALLAGLVLRFVPRGAEPSDDPDGGPGGPEGRDGP